MSTKAFLYVDKVDVATMFDFFPLLPVFTEDDRTEWPEDWPVRESLIDHSMMYAVSVEQALDRIKSMNASLNEARLDFEETLADLIHDSESVLFESPDVPNWTFDQFLEVIAERLTSDGMSVDQLLESQDARSASITAFVNSGVTAGAELFSDMTLWLRALLSVADPNSHLLLDVSEFVRDEVFPADEGLFSWHTAKDYADEVAQTIILTEGSSDYTVLSGSLGLLFPHLSHYYTFLDMDVFKVPGGAGNLANVMKAFAGARIRNRVIGIFDNDTAGLSGMNTLRKVAMPGHFRALRLPKIALATSYPTIGPTGPSPVDVNGTAAGIELYLGPDVLDFDGALSPVLWSGYDKGVKQYQGEVRDKEEVHVRFRQKLAAAQSGAELDQDWDDLRLVWRNIIDAFETPQRYDDDAGQP